MLHRAVTPLKDLLTLRRKLLVQITTLSTGQKELVKTGGIAKEFSALSAKLLKLALQGLKQSLKKAQEEIKKHIQGNREIGDVYRRLLSVPGIGHVTAVSLICHSNVFTLCASGKQLACYCGVVPFDYQSGTSIKGRRQVHKMANGELKHLLHMCAISSIKNHPEFTAYCQRKKEEGKHAFSILNAIKNKIVLRAFAVVKNERDYVNNYKQLA